MNYKKRFECGCEIHAILEGETIIGSDIHQCPKHKAVDDLYEACNAGLRFLVDIHELLMEHPEYIERAKELNNQLWQAHDKAVKK